MRTLTIATLLFCTLGARSAPIKVGINISGWNTSYTEHPLGGTNPGAPGAVLSDAAKNKIGQIAYGGGEIRWMDGLQTVGSPQTSPANRSTNNLAAIGVTWESMAAVSNQTHTRPWVNGPQGSAAFFDNPGADVTQSYAYQMGRTLALNTDKRLGYLKYEFSNELWNGGDGNQGTQNLYRARAHPLTTPGASDFQKLSEMAYIDWFRTLRAFKAGVDSAGKGFEVRGVAPGFIANHYYSIYGLQRLQQVFGSDPQFAPLLAKSRIAIAPYAPGSPNDIGNIQPGDTAATIMARTKAFVEQNYPTWFSTNRNDALYFGLQGLDLYETMALSTYDFTSGTNKLVDMARTANDPAVRAFHTWFLNYTSDMSDGVLDGKNADPDVSMIVFGSAGIPYSEQFGQWAVWESYLSGDTSKSLGIKDFVAANANNVDPMAGVPEPAGLLLLAGAGLLAIRTRRAA